MNGLGTSLVWGAVQVSLFSLVGVVAYTLVRRRGPYAGALAVLAAIVMVLGVSVLAFSPWPHWWHWNAGAAGLADAAQKADTGTTLQDELSANGMDSKGKEVAGVSPTLQSKTTAARDRLAVWQAAWSGFFEGLQTAQTPRGTDWHWPALAACVLLAGIGIGLIRLALGLVAVARYRRQSSPIDEAVLADHLAVIQAELGCARPVQIHQSAALDSPAVVGWLRPLVLLPKDWRTWTDDERRAVLAHEVAHVARNDYAGWLMAQLALVVHFYNPLIHWLVGRLRIEQELAADAGGEPRSAGGREAYLATLARMALRLDNRQAGWAARPFLPARGTFLRRIEMLRDAKSVRQTPLASTGRAFLLGTLTAAALLVAGLRAPFAGAGAAPITGAVTERAAGNAGALSMDFIPGDALFAVSFRPAELIRMKGIEELFAKTESAGTKRLMADTGIHPQDLAEMSFSILKQNLEMQKAAGGMLFQTSIQTTTDQNWKEVASKFLPAFVEVECGNGKYYKPAKQVPEGAEHCFTIPNNRTLVIAPELAIREMIKSGGRYPRPAWADGWEKVAGDQVAAMVDFEAVRKILATITTPNSNTAAFLGMFAPLWDNSKVGFAGLRLDKNLSFHALTESSTEEGARKASQTVQAMLTLAENGLGVLAKAPEGARQPDAAFKAQTLGIIGDLIKHAKVTQQGKVVNLKTVTEMLGADNLASLLGPAVAKADEAANRVQSVNNLKQIALAMFNYESAAINASRRPCWSAPTRKTTL